MPRLIQQPRFLSVSSGCHVLPDTHQALILAPRALSGMEFRLKLNRLNVATSRDKCLAKDVVSQGLLVVRCRTPRQKHSANVVAHLYHTVHQANRQASAHLGCPGPQKALWRLSEICG